MKVQGDWFKKLGFRLVDPFLLFICSSVPSVPLLWTRPFLRRDSVGGRIVDPSVEPL